MSSPPPSVPLPPPIDAPAKGGCWRTGVIGCGAVAVVVVLLFIAGVLYLSRRPEAMSDLLMSALESNLGPDVTEEDKRELRAAYAEFRKALKEKRIGRQEREDLQSEIRFRSGEPVSRERVLRMIELFRRAGRSPAPAGEPASTPTALPAGSP